MGSFVSRSTVICSKGKVRQFAPETFTTPKSGMEVTKATWNDAVVAEWRQAVEECDFIAMDTELTGLADGYRSNRCDSAATRFAKNRKAAAEFALTQLGLCAFRKDALTGSWTAKPLSAYVLPQKKAFMVEGSAVTFLQSHRFDFNKWSKGIDYLPHSEETAAQIKGRLQALGNALQAPDVATVNRGHDVQFLYRRAYVPLINAIAAAQQQSQGPTQEGSPLVANIEEGERAPAWTVLHSEAASVQVPGHDWVSEAEAASGHELNLGDTPDIQVDLPSMQCVRLGCAFDSFPRKMLRDLMHCGSWSAWVAASGAEAAWLDLQERQAAKAAEFKAAEAAAAAEAGQEACQQQQQQQEGQEEQAPTALLDAMPDLGVQLAAWAVDYDQNDQALPDHGVNRWRKVVRLYNLQTPSALLPDIPQWLQPHMPAACTPEQQQWMWWQAAKNTATAAAKVSQAVGVRQLWDIVARSGKPVAGHNCLLDLLHLSDAFLGSVAAHPHQWASKQVLQQLCTGGVLDSKHLLLWMRQHIAAEAPAGLPLPALQLKQALESKVGRGPTGLGTAFAALEALRGSTEPPPGNQEQQQAEGEVAGAAADAAALDSIVPRFNMESFASLAASPGADSSAGEEDANSSAEASQTAAQDFAHDAAYDAYMTGCIVAHVHEYMHALQTTSGGMLSQGNAAAGAGGDNTPTSGDTAHLPAVRGAHNTLHVMWSRHASEWCLSASAEWYLEDAKHWRQARVRTLHVDRLNHTIGTRHLVDMTNAALGAAGVQPGAAVAKEDVIWVDDRSGVVQLPSEACLEAILQWSKQEQSRTPSQSRWRLASLPSLSAFELSSWAQHVRQNAELYGPLALQEATMADDSREATEPLAKKSRK